MDGQGQEDFAVFRIGLSEHATADSAIADVVISLKALADVDASPTDAIPCEVAAPNGVYRGEDKAVFSTELSANQQIDVEARGQVHPQWKTQWEIAVARSE